MALTLTGFVYDNAGNPISGATVQGYVTADDQTSGTTAEDSVTTNSDGKWAITTSTAARIPMDVKITYGSNVRWIKAGDKLNVTDMTVTGTLTVGEDAAGFDFALYSSDSAGDGLTWDASEEVLQITGKNGATSLDVLDGDVRIVDKLYFYDRGGEYLSSDGSTLTITGATTIGALSLTSMSSNWTNAGRTVADMGIATTIDINGGTIDGAVIGGASAAAVTGTAVTGTSLVGGTVAGTTGTFSGVVDVTDATDSSDATGDTGALKTEGGASIAKKLYVGTDLSVGGNLTISGTTTTVDTTNTLVTDNLLELNSGATSNANDSGIIIERGSTGNNAILMWDESADVFTVGTTTATADSTGNLANFAAAPFTAAAINGTVITASSNFAGALTGNVTGNASGTAATVTGGTQASITTVANVVEVGALDAGSITSGFTSIDVGAGGLTTTGAIAGGTIDAGTDFTIGDTVITDGVITDTSGLQIAGTLHATGQISVPQSTRIELDGPSGNDGIISTSASTVGIVVNGTAQHTFGIAVHNMAQSGTVSLPAYVMGNDTDSGMYRVSANTIGFATGGVLGLQINSSQNIWIPAGDVFMAPTQKLYLDNGNDTYIYEESADDLHIVSGNVAWVQIDNNVGMSFGSSSAPNIQAQTMFDGSWTAGEYGGFGVGIETDITGAAGATALAHMGIRPLGQGSITTQNGSITYTDISSLKLAEPGITKGSDTVTVAATLYIANAPDEGAANYAIYMPSGSLGVSDGDGSSGEQLTSGGAAGNVTWAAASSERSSKTAIMERSNDAEVLATLVGTPVHDFKYISDPSRPNTGDYKTDYVGIIADEAPWAMHHNGRILNPINTFGYTVQGFKALEARISDLESQLGAS